MKASFDFYGTKMTVRLSSEQAGQSYCIIEMNHPPFVGPALHVHPTHPESFCILEGGYTFWVGDQRIELSAGDSICVPAGTPHKYKVGPSGGRVLVVAPPELSQYFLAVSRNVAAGVSTLAEEQAIARRHGQVFLEDASNWTANS